MTLFLVINDCGYEGLDVVGIFTDADKAIDTCRKEKNWKLDIFEVPADCKINIFDCPYVKWER